MRILALCFFLLGSVGQAWASDTFYYQSYHEKTKEVVNTFSIRIGELKNNQRHVWWDRKGDQVVHEEYVLDSSWATLSWHVSIPADQTDYSGKRVGNNLFLKGKFKGEAINKELPIGKEPFYYNPKLGLRALAESKAKKMEFWAIRHDTLGHFKMVGVKKKRRMITIQGKKIEAEGIFWYAKIDIARLFKRTYWFRLSDGVFVKEIVSGDLVRALTGES